MVDFWSYNTMVTPVERSENVECTQSFWEAYQSAVWHIALLFFPGPLRWGKTETTGFPTRPIAGCRTIGTTTSAGMDGQEAGRPNDWQNEMILCLVELWLTTHEVPWTKIQFQ